MLVCFSLLFGTGCNRYFPIMPTKRKPTRQEMVGTYKYNAQCAVTIELKLSDDDTFEQMLSSGPKHDIRGSWVLNENSVAFTNFWIDGQAGNDVLWYICDSNDKKGFALIGGDSTNTDGYYIIERRIPMAVKGDQQGKLHRRKLLGYRGDTIVACALPSERFNTRSRPIQCSSPATSEETSFAPQTKSPYETG